MPTFPVLRDAEELWITLWSLVPDASGQRAALAVDSGPVIDYCYRMTISKSDVKDADRSAIERELFRGFIRVHILHHAAEEPVFGQALKEELERHGYRLSFGTLYPILHRLEQDGLLACERRTVGGKVRKYYRITATGRLMLKKARGYLRELVDEVLGGCGSPEEA